MGLFDRCVVESVWSPELVWANLADVNRVGEWAATELDCSDRHRCAVAPAEIEPGDNGSSDVRGCVLVVADQPVIGTLTMQHVHPGDELRLTVRTPVVSVLTSVVLCPGPASGTTVFVEISACSRLAASYLRPWFVDHVNLVRSALDRWLADERGMLASK